MLTTTTHWQRFSSPQAPEMIARSMFGIDAQLAEAQGGQATEPVPAEPPEPTDAEVADQSVLDPDDPSTPVTGESDDQEPAPR